MKETGLVVGGECYYWQPQGHSVAKVVVKLLSLSARKALISTGQFTLRVWLNELEPIPAQKGPHA